MWVYWESRRIVFCHLLSESKLSQSLSENNGKQNRGFVCVFSRLSQSILSDYLCKNEHPSIQKWINCFEAAAKRIYFLKRMLKNNAITTKLWLTERYHFCIVKRQSFSGASAKESKHPEILRD
jgi:hypothetical protein